MWAGGPLHRHPRGFESQAQASHPSSRELSPKPQGGWLVLPSDLPQTTGLFLQGLPKATSTRWRVIIPGAGTRQALGPGKEGVGEVTAGRPALTSSSPSASMTQQRRRGCVGDILLCQL